ncbi:hypothetical protein GIB67_014712 [Kingdonia uniflora]|uniref:TF-B3 domain-containing protein n=1 Tax=Kingdonia uniflora TaxID=39325 RepID=A0A7J7NUK8_9MAGN|nr:hypothetical protein GIB67_014712 [Kingdonia uniflora]
MVVIQFYNFLVTKDEEGRRGEESSSFPLVPTSYEVVEIRDDPPVLLELFHPWEVKIVLQEGDGGLQDKLTIKGHFVPRYLALDWATINNGVQVPILVKDLDTNSCYNMYWRKWLDDGRFTISHNWNLNFVQRRGLRAGDTIGLYWDRHSPWAASLCFSLLERAGSE